MELNRSRSLPPDQRDWLERPKNKRPDASIIGLFLGMLILAGMICFAFITPDICDSIAKSLVGDYSVLIPDSSTEFQIAGVTYNTKDIVIDLFNRAV